MRVTLIAVLSAAYLLWVGWLASLALRKSDTPSLRRAQVLAADAAVIADVADSNGRPADTLTVREALWPEGVALAGPLQVRLLPDATGYGRPGSYVVPLTRERQSFAVTRYYEGHHEARETAARVYPATPALVAEVRAVRGGAKK